MVQFRKLLLQGSLAVIGAVVFATVFTAALSRVPANNYEARDDGLITLSHARNLVEFGFIGVSPSGERIEGFSAPLQFLTAAAAYALSPFDYHSFFRWQLLIGTLLLGSLIAITLQSGGGSASVTARYVFVALAIVGSAAILTSSKAFLLWHASGMENVYKTVGMLALLACLDRMLRRQQILWWSLLIVLAASLSRIDAIVGVGLWLTAFGFIWLLQHRNVRGLAFAAVSALPWVLCMAWRYWYFGQWNPNTAAAQHIEVSARLAALVQSPTAVIADTWLWFRDTAVSLHLFHLLWLPIALFWARRSALAWHRAAFVLLGLLAGVIQYVALGAVRLDPARTVTELAVYAAIGAPFVLLAVDDFSVRDAAVGILIVAVSVSVSLMRPPDRTEIGWGTTYFETNADRFDAIAREQSIPRPLVANADLGALSWRKHANVLDLGFLGSAILPRLTRVPDYILAVAKPDLVEIHDAWSCIYRDIFTNQEFSNEYQAIESVRTEWLASNCQDAPLAVSGLWIRKAIMKGSTSPERNFMDRMLQRFDLATLDQEITRCKADAGTHPCDYVGRTLYRFVPELKRTGQFDATLNRLANDPQLRVERAYVSSSVDPNWWRVAAAASEPPAIQPASLSLFSLQDGSRSSHGSLSISDPFRVGWRIEAPDGLRVEPTSGIGSLTATLSAKPMAQPTDHVVDIRLVADSAAASASVTRVRFKTFVSIDTGPPIGAVDAPVGNIHLGTTPMVFQGWAVDPFDLRGVVITYNDRNGETVTLGEAHRGGFRPDIAALLPNAHDLFNAGWTFVLDPRLVKGVGLPLTIHVQAKGSRQISEIGVRTIER
jgi:hypothetical protein